MTDTGRQPGARLAAAWREDRHVVLVALLFLGLGAIWLGSVAHYHGDERYYTDAALRMLERHDPWTPVYASGAARLNKPLATYWVVLATYALAGVSLFLSRLPFLVAGALLVWLTGRLARVMFPGERGVALLAACIVAADVAIVTLARRSTPDILLVLFATATLYGLARILVAREAGISPRLWLWVGAGAAVATKGGLGLVVLAFAFAAAIAMRPRNGAEGGRVRLFAPIPVLLGAGIALVALLPGFLASEPAGGPTMFQDQLGARLPDSPLAVIKQLGNYTTSLLKHFAPWIVLLLVALVAARPALRERWRRDRRAILLALSWTAVLLVVFALANTLRGRYLAPAHPILACPIAAWLHDASRAPALRRTARVLWITLGVLAAAGALALLRADRASAISLALVASAALVGWNLVADESREMRALALGLLAAMAVGFEAVRALVDPSPVPIACSRMSEAHIDPRRVATVGIFESTASQMRVVSRGQLDPSVLPASAAEQDFASFDALLAVQPAGPAVERAGLRTEVISRTAPDLTPGDAWSWLTSADPRAWLAERGEPVLLAIRPPAH
jgi:4-amino-4-deoxy-L-arabinose transferase-like glycosyltransferase